MDKKAHFKEFSENHKNDLPFSLHYKWWNEVVLTDWEVAVVLKNNQPIAVMPYYVRKKGPWLMIANPHFTPYTGPFIIYPDNQKTASKIAYEHDVINELIAQLPKFAEYTQNFHLEFKNALSFQWNNFEDTNRYTYLLDLTQEADDIFSGFRENAKRQIKKALKSVTVENCTDYKLVEQLCQESFPNSIESDYFIRIVKFLEKYSCGKIYKATDNGKNHSILLSIWDKKSAYSLIGGSAKEFRKSGAMSLLMWKAIKNAKQLGLKQFNFEGSSIKTIEQYFRGFGGELVSFRRIVKNNSKALELAKKLKG